MRSCQADRLVDFLRSYSAHQLFLVGDIIDFEALEQSIYWAQAHNTVVLREYIDATFGDIRIASEWVHIAADGKRYLLVHGDEFDPVSRCSRFMAAVGHVAYTALLRLNRLLAWWRHRFGADGYWSLSSFVKQRIRRAADYILDFEAAVVRAAKTRGFDGVICGHIHVAAIREMDNVVYINCGDWVDSCTAVVEHLDGRFELVRWGARPAVPAARSAELDVAAA
jgi:UDP-2,3-diacylglucosamine pyrophosphatase LpxH